MPGRDGSTPMVMVLLVAVIMLALIGVRVPAVKTDRFPESHDGFRDVIEKRRQLVPIDGALLVHVVYVEDELHLLIVNAAGVLSSSRVDLMGSAT